MSFKIFPTNTFRLPPPVKITHSIGKSIYSLFLISYRKIERLRQSLDQQPMNLDKAIKNYNRLQNEEKRNANTVERRKFKELSKEHDSLERSQGYAHSIQDTGG